MTKELIGNVYLGKEKSIPRITNSIIWEMGAQDIVAWTSMYKLSEDHFEFDMCLGDLQDFVGAPRCHLTLSGIARSPHA